MSTQSNSGPNTITGTSGSEHLNGGSGADTIYGMGGNDRINAGSGDDVMDGGTGNDIVSGDSGNDLGIYVLGENVGSTDVYDGGSGIDTIRLVMTRAEWQTPAVQADLARYLTFLAQVTNPVNGQATNANFTFSFGLTVSKFETLQVTVDGVRLDPRDQAVILVDDVMAAGEESISTSVDVLLNDTVPDLIAALTNTQPAHGSVTLTRTSGAPGTPDTASFVYTPSATHWQYLAAGQTSTDSFTYTVTDSDGDVSTATVTVTITGTNDAPTITSAVSSGAVVEDGVLASSGTIAFADVDLRDAHTVTSTADAAGYLGTFTATVTDDGTGDGAGSVTWNFSVDNAATQYLAAGETLTQAYTVTVSDGQGGTVSQPVTVTITGTNDAPVITVVDVRGSVTEAEPVNGVPAASTPVLFDAETNDTFATAQLIDRADLRIASGNTNLADPTDPSIRVQGSIATRNDQDVFRIDLAAGETLTLDIDFAGIIPGVGGLDSFVFLYDAAGNVLNFNDDSSTTLGGGGSTSTQDSFLQFVASMGGTYYIVVKDFDLFGQSSAGTYALNVSVDSQNLQLTDAGSMTFTDVDLRDTHTINVAAEGSDYLGALTAVVSNDSTNDGAGNVNWTFSVANAAVQFLAAGETRTQTYTVTVDDGQGGTASETVTVTITGENDRPVISTAFSSGQVTENVILAATGVIAFDDVDLIDSHSVTSAADGSGYLGAFSASISDPATGAGGGEISWTFNASDAELQFLAAGESRLQRYIVTLDDGNGGTTQQLVNITITGTNDAPTISAAETDAAGSVTAAPIDPATVAPAAPISFLVEQFTGFQSNDLNTLRNYAANNSADYTANTGVIDYTDDPAGFSGELPGSSPWPAAVAAGQSGTGGVNDVFFARITSQFSVETADTYTFRTFNDDGVFLLVDGVLIIADSGYHPEAPFEGSISLTPGNHTIELFFFENGGEASLELSVRNSSGQFGLLGGTGGGLGGVIRQLTDTGVISFADVDLADGHTVAVAPQGTDYLGSLTAEVSDSSTGDGEGEVTWTFNVSNSAVQFLGAGETRTQVYAVSVNDGRGGTVTQNVTVTITGSNLAPVVSGGVFAGATVEDGQVTAAGTVAFTDVNLIDAHAVSSTAGGTDYLGTFTTTVTDNGAGDGAGSVNWNFSVDNAAVQFLAVGQVVTQTYTVAISDGQGGTVSQPVTVTITGTNDAPVANADLATTNEDTPVTFDVRANDTDVDGGAPTVTHINGSPITAGASVALAGGGLVAMNTNGTLTYTPAANANGARSFDYTISDGLGGSATSTVNLTINPVNDRPVAVNDTGAAIEAGGVLNGTPGQAATGNVLTNDTDIDDAVLVVSAERTGAESGSGTSGTVGAPLNGAYGTLTLNANGSYSYVVNETNASVQALAAGQVLTESFTYTVRDAAGLTDTAQLTLTINGANDAPVAQNLTLQANQLGNGGFDATPNFSGWTVSTATSGMSSTSSSSAVIDRSGGIIPGDSAVAVLQFTGNVPTRFGTGFGPSITSTSFEGQAGDTVRFVYKLSSGGDYANGTGYIRDAVTGAIVQTIFNYQTPFTGSTGVVTQDVVLASSGNYVIDFRVGSYDATGGFFVGARLDLGFAGILRNGVGEDESFTFATSNFLAGATDVDGGPLSVVSVGPSANGAVVTLNADGSVLYNPAGNLDFLAAGQSLVDTFEYTISDGRGGFSTATASVKVVGKNDGPVANTDLVSTNEDTAVTFDVRSNDTDVDSPNLNVTHINGSAIVAGASVLLADGAAVLMNADGSLTYTPAPNANGAKGFTYTISDGQGGTATSSVDLTVNPVNDAPTASADSVTTSEDGSLTLAAATLMANDSDLDGDTLSILSVNGSASVGTVQLVGGQIVYSPGSAFQTLRAGQTALDQFTYTVTDASGATATATVDVVINGANDAPTAGDDSAFANAGGSVTINVLANDSDPEGEAITIASVGTAANGTVVINADGTVKYTPNAGYSGNDTFTYAVQDASGAVDTATVSLVVGLSDHDRVGGDVFLQGNFMEIGVSASGSLGTASAAPANYHPQGRANISYVVDTDGWTSGAAPRAGDFTLPGTPVDTIVLGFNGVSYAQDERNGRRDIATTTTDISTGSLLGAQTVGVAGGAVRLTQTITLDPGATYYTTTITVTNVSGAAVNDVRFMRSFDPDQDQFRYGNFTTNNDVLSNPTAGNDLAVSRALGPNSGVSVNLLSFDEDARASNFGFANNDAYATQAYNAPVDLNGQLVDQAITMAFNFGTLAAGETMTKVFFTSLNGSSQANDMLIGGTGADVLNAAAGDDFVIGLTGDDQLTGGTGDDTFVFSRGSGRDVVTDFTAGTGTDDVLELRGFGISDLAGIRAVSSQVGADVVINLSATDSITLRGVQLADLSNDDFAFNPVHSSDWI